MSSNQYTFFGEVAGLDQAHDPLAQLSGYIDFELFRPRLEAAVAPKREKIKPGRPRWDVVVMFKVLVLQRIYGLSDEQAEFQLRDRLSFHRFLNLALGDRVPDSRTIWSFREQLAKAGTIDQLFVDFAQTLLERGVITREGTLVDASFVTVPKQQNTRAENALIKQAKVPPKWRDQPRKLSQHDLDARWTIKGITAYYGYKNHVKVDRDSKLIVNYAVTQAAMNDGKMLPVLVNADDRIVHADCAYQTPANRAWLQDRNIINKVHVKGTRHVVLSKGQRRSNQRKSKIRARVEHTFGFMKNSLSGLHFEYIGLPRIAAATALTNLLYNLYRAAHLHRSAAATA